MATGFPDFLGEHIQNVHKFYLENYAPMSQKFDNIIEDLKAEAESLVQRAEKARKAELSSEANENLCPNVRVKLEKMSISSNPKSATDMPAPKAIPPKKKRVKKENLSIASKESTSKTEDESDNEKLTRVTRSYASRSAERNSDVVFVKPAIPEVILAGSDEESSIKPKSTRSTRTRKRTIVEKEEPEPPIRTTRTKTRAMMKREETFVAPENSPPKTTEENNTSGQTVYEDAIAEVEKPANATYVQSEDNAANATFSVAPAESTFVVSKSKQIQNSKEEMVPDKAALQHQTADSLLTDDESMADDRVISQEEENHVSPIKKKIEVFENLRKETPVKLKTTKTSEILQKMEEKKGNVQKMIKGFSPLLHQSTYSKVQGMDTTPNPTEKRFGRILSKQARENRALSEDRNKKHEERVAKIKQQKEALENARKMKLLEQQKKDERARQILLEKEEQLRLAKEEKEKKRLLAKQRAEELRRKEALELKNHTEKKRVRENKEPRYLLEPAPLLTCVGAYDSDDERSKLQSKKVPYWALSANLEHQLQVQADAGHKLKNTLFCAMNNDVDLQELFGKIDAGKLKRSSSAYWSKPPRFTMYEQINK